MFSYKHNHTINHRLNSVSLFAGILAIITFFSALLLSAPHASASNSSTINVSLKVMAACSLSATTGPDLSTTINAGGDGLIGTTSLKAVCNDNGGLAIYAIGYTGSVHGDTNLRKQESGDTLSATNLIPTGVSSSTSYWNMTVTNNTSIQNNYSATIPVAFQSAHEVPTNQTQIASYSSTTDQTTGLNVNIDYNVHAALDQSAGTYKGKVKYTLVHPALHVAPASRPATLDTGQTINSKMKTLAASVVDGATYTISYNTSDSHIKAIEVHTSIGSLPSGLTPSVANTISSSTSEHPIYIVFDNTNDTGVMHLYTTGDKIVLPAEADYMFNKMFSLSDLSDLADWDASNVESMSCMFSSTGYYVPAFSLDLSGWDTSNTTSMDEAFYYAGYSASTFSLDLSGWDTSSVTSAYSMFYYAGYSATTWSIIGLSDFDTSSIERMDGMFAYAGYSASTFSLDLSGWDTSSVTTMYDVFNSAGYSATAWSVLGLSDWDTSNVEYMAYMFEYAGYSASTFSLDLSNWNTSNVESTWFMFDSTGYSASTFSLDLSGWNTSSVSDMGNMFNSAGYSATTWSIIIPQTNGGGVNNTTSYMYGYNANYHCAAPPSGRSFTLAQ